MNAGVTPDKVGAEGNGFLVEAVTTGNDTVGVSTASCLSREGVGATRAKCIKIQRVQVASLEGGNKKMLGVLESST